MSRRPGRAARSLVLLAAAIGALVGAAAPAGAEEQPAIVKAYGLDWIERVREDAWPQPRDRRPVVCLLDTGVAITPDTPADDPAGPIVARLAIDGGSGEPQGTAPEHAHGTQMASIIAAPRNGYGTVGIFPQARIVSVRATNGTATYMTPSDMELAVRSCGQWAVGAGVSISAVVVAESGYAQRSVDTPSWEKAAAAAAQLRGALVAAAGNAVDATLVPPASAENVLAVSAGDEDGNACNFAVHSVGIGLRGPGCHRNQSADPSWPSGSSAATAAVGALVAALAAKDPSVHPFDWVRLLKGQDRHADGTARLDGAAYSGRFDGQIDGARSLPRELHGFDSPPSPPAVTLSPAGAPERSTARTVMWRPTVRLTRRARSVRAVRTQRLEGVLQIRFLGRDGRRLGRVQRSRVATHHLPFVPTRAEMWVQSRDRSQWRSLTTRVKLGK